MSRSLPTVSVVVPTRDRPALLERALRSVREQEFRDFELIVVDDGSAEPIDRALDACRPVRARVLTHAARRGAAAARNTGLGEARGRFVAFLDDDDRWLPAKLARQVERLLSAPAGTGVVYCGYRLVSDLTGQTDRCYEPSEPAAGFEDFLKSSLFGSSIPLIGRECLDVVGPFDESLPATHDRDLWLRLARRFAFAFVPGMLVDCHIHGRQITTDLAAKLVARERLLEKYRADLERRPSVYAAELVRLGMLHFAAGHAERGRECLRSAVEWGASAKRLAKHVALSLENPEEHRALVTRTAFRELDGCTLY